MQLKELAERGGTAALEELRDLQKQAEIGRAYCAKLKDELLRLSTALELDIEKSLLRSAVEKLAPEELKGLEAALSKKAAQRFGPVTQLPTGSEKNAGELETDYLI